MSWFDKDESTQKPEKRILTTSPKDYMTTPPVAGDGLEEKSGEKPFWTKNIVVGSAVVLAMGAMVTAIGVTPSAPVQRGVSSPSSVSSSYEPPSSSSALFEEIKPEEPESQAAAMEEEETPIISIHMTMKSSKIPAQIMCLIQTL